MENKVLILASNGNIPPSTLLLVGRVPAFQAGCREFESRLPLLFFNRLFAGAWQAASEEASSEGTRTRRFVFLTEGVQRTPASFCGKHLPHVLGQPAFEW